MHYRLPSIALAASAALIISGCSADSDEAAETTASASPATTAAAASAEFSDERCETNKAVGEITFATGYYYQASVGILNVVAADELGYFDDLCLDVTIQPGTGDTAQNTQLLAANTIQFTSMDVQNVILASENDIDIMGVSVFSDVGLDILMTPTDVTGLTELEGTILGQKGSLPTTVAAMLSNAGVDIDAIEQVTVGYDPSILPRGQVDSLTGFISNEPNLLAASGEDVTVWRPYDYDVPSSMGVTAVNPEFAAENPTVVEDFLRAVLHGYDYCVANGEECVGYASAASGPGYDEDHNLAVWNTEVDVVTESHDTATALGHVDPELISSIYAFLTEYELVSADLGEDGAQALFDDSFNEAIYDGTDLLWPATS
ncbi:ABC transporter substrate-binding protein [Demequina sediminicola]|uniref:ABC transporter substrate-binding protein n=1 Tax=Demequina sediminicola TaxID=1095026 RepID=UPI0009E25D7A|nr:ABC transporter substrate-binding protein [Demequina sediminicola]